MRVFDNILPSNKWKVGRESSPDTIIIHYISAINISKNDPYNVDNILSIFNDYKISCHYLIARSGQIHRLVHPNNTSWHAGKSKMLNGKKYRNSVNDFSIGIEMIGGKWEDFTEKQYTALVDLTVELRSIYQIPLENIVGHSTVAPIRKVDPGPFFQWDFYYDKIRWLSERKKINEVKEKRVLEITENSKLDMTPELKENNISLDSANDSWFVVFKTKLKELININKGKD